MNIEIAEIAPEKTKQAGADVQAPAYTTVLRPVTILSNGDIQSNVVIDGRREYFIRYLDGSGDNRNPLGEFASFDLSRLRVVELDKYSDVQKKEGQLRMLIGSGYKIIETDDPQRFLAYKEGEIWE